MRRPAAVLLTLLWLAALMACSPAGPTRAAGPAGTTPAPTPPATTSAPAPTSAGPAPAGVPTPPAATASRSAATTSPARAPTVAPRPASPTPHATTAPPPPAVPALVAALGSTGGAGQLVVVTAPTWGSTYATLSAFQRSGSAWQAVVSGVPARVGRTGMSTNHHEGDGSTPAGLFGFTEMFGIQANPGVHYGYRQVDACSWWLEGSTPAPYYNTWQEIGSCPGARWSTFQPGWDANPQDSEHLIDAVPAYEYAAVIGYNAPDAVGAATPGRGSAIFLHVAEGSPTAGCVAVDAGTLLRVLRWLDPAQHPLVAIAPTSYLASV